MTRLRERLTTAAYGLMLAAACTAMLVLAGCSAAGSTTDAGTRATPAPRHDRRHHRPRPHHAPRPHHRSRPRHRKPPSQPATLGAALPTSTASATRIQPQPPSGSCHARGAGLFSLPDPRCTPGAIDPRVTQSDIRATICRDGYTETVRPAESITEPEKEASLASYGDTLPLHYYEYDHLVPLELGGAPNDPRNLWPEPGATPNPKDELENRLRELVCNGAMILAVAQREIAHNWVAAYRHLFG